MFFCRKEEMEEMKGPVIMPYADFGRYHNAIMFKEFLSHYPTIQVIN